MSLCDIASSSASPKCFSIRLRNVSMPRRTSLLSYCESKFRAAFREYEGLDAIVIGLFGKNAWPPAVIHLLKVVIHVFNQKNMIVQHFFVFGVVAHSSSRHLLCLSASAWTFLGNDFETIKHRLVDPDVRIINQASHLHHTLRWALVVFSSHCSKHILDSSTEMWEDFDETDDALALLDLDLRVFDCADLIIDEFRPQILQFRDELVEHLQQELLICLLEIESMLAKASHHADTLNRKAKISSMTLATFFAISRFGSIGLGANRFAPCLAWGGIGAISSIAPAKTSAFMACAPEPGKPCRPSAEVLPPPVPRKVFARVYASSFSALVKRMAASSGLGLRADHPAFKTLLLASDIDVVKV
ncbi:hypothetical protein KC340_g32 [Hortaea werneckii]|nr:hypothetical protein KC340_g32 [Hortaea werneckii]